MKTTSALLFVVVILLSLTAAPAARAQLSQAQLDAIEEAAYQKALAEIQAKRAAAAAAAGAVSPLAAPQRPAADAGPEAWANYNNAVAAWNQRTAAAQQKTATDAARDRQRQAALDQAESIRRRAAKEEQERLAKQAAYDRWLREREVQALEALARKSK